MTWVDLPALFADFHREHGGVRITLREETVDDLIVLVRGGDLDLAFVALDEQGVPEDLAVLASHEEELVLRPFIDFKCGTGLQSVVERLCERSGLPTIALQHHDVHRRVALIARTPEPTNPAARAVLPGLLSATSR